MKEKLKKAKDNVAVILDKYPETRASDNMLFRIYLQVYYGITLPTIEATIPYETLSRCRRYWQSIGRYRPLEDSVIQARAEAEQIYKEEFGANAKSLRNVSSF